MLNIFYGRESIVKENFIFDNIGESALVIVPDQFTLAAERTAIKCLEVDGLMDIEIISMSRLSSRILKEQGGTSRVFVDKYGRHILLAKIMTEVSGKLQAFTNMGERSSFLEMANNLISELKQYGISPAELDKIAKGENMDALLARKLSDIAIIYDEYEKKIAGRYIDTEDYINLYIPKIEKSDLVRDREIWIWGFDVFAPKHVDIIMELAKVARVNIVMTYAHDVRDAHIFEITGSVISNLKKRTLESGIKYSISQIDDRYSKLCDGDIERGKRDIKISPAIAELERELFALPQRLPSEHAKNAAQKGRVVLLNAANYYTEAESAAVYVLWLIREKGLRLKDIAIICNDLELRGGIIKRVFEEYGLHLFVDNKRSLVHHPAIVFVSALLDVACEGYRTEDIFRMLKTGFAGLDEENIEELENYAIKYKIRGTMWKKPFAKGTAEYGEYRFGHIEKSRSYVADFIARFESKFKESKSASDRTNALYEFLKNDAKLPQSLQSMIDELTEKGMYEQAEETAQIWQYLLGVMRQVTLLLADDKLSLKAYKSIFEAGLSVVEIGLLPPSTDDLVIGTMQRSRTEEIKALIVLGANEGELPKSSSPEELISEDEKKLLIARGHELSKLSEIQTKEEQLAIYRGISSPSHYLYMSCTLSDENGKKQRPCTLFSDIKGFYDLNVKGDIASSLSDKAKAEAPRQALRYLTNELAEGKLGRNISEKWLMTYSWLKANRPEETGAMLEGIFYRNEEIKIGKDRAKGLYARAEGELVLSPSSLEKYSRCPFAHFVSYGLGTEERRRFEIAGREIGDIYHECLMRFFETLTEKDIKVSDEQSKWQKISEEECYTLTNQIFDEVASGYREGIASNGEEEAYRIGRMKDILAENAWVLVKHVRAGKIDTMSFETGFGKSKVLSPIIVKSGDDEIRIEGKIDRIDYLEGDSVKIIDYKSRDESIKPIEAKEGWRLQLMLYLKAALGSKKPAGVFYYNIIENEIKAGGLDSNKLAEKIANYINEYKMNGILIDSGNVIESIDSDFEKYSSVVTGLSKINSKEEKGKKEYKCTNLLTGEEYAEFSACFDKMIAELCEKISGGEADIKPKKIESISACTYCMYKSICRFDQSFEGCSFERLSC